MSSRTTSLRKSADFRRVYEDGKRFDGRLMTIFVRRNEFGQHRFGITASKRVSQHAVDRNRAKRLLRETFRLSEMSLQGVEVHCDWVLNVKRSLLRVKLADSMGEFQKLVTSVMRDAEDFSRSDER